MNVARDTGAPSAQIRSPGPAAGRVIAGAACGCAAAVVALADGVSWSVAALCASDVAVLVFIVWVWIGVHGADPATTSRLARTEDASPVAAESVLIGAGAASLVAVAFTLSRAGDASAPARGLLSALAMGSVALAWTSVHTVHVLRYARLYSSEPEVGVDLGGQAPDYTDFENLALTIGMTFQGSDTRSPQGSCGRSLCTMRCRRTSTGR